MTDDASPLQYKEVRDYALVERVLRQRRLTIPTVVTLIASALAVALALYHVYVAGFGTPESHSFRSTHLAVMMVLAVLVYPLFRNSVSDPLSGANPGETAKRKIGLTRGYTHYENLADEQFTDAFHYTLFPNFAVSIWSVSHLMFQVTHVGL